MKNNIKEMISKSLKKLRTDKGMTQSELSKQCGVDISTIVRYEKNNVTMQIDTLIKIVESYGIDMFIFFNQIVAKTQENDNNSNK